MYLVGSTSIGQKSGPPVNRIFRWSISRITTFWAQIWNRSDPFYILTFVVGFFFGKCKYWKFRLRSVNYFLVWRFRFFKILSRRFEWRIRSCSILYRRFEWRSRGFFSSYIGVSNDDPTFCIELFYRHRWGRTLLLTGGGSY